MNCKVICLFLIIFVVEEATFAQIGNKHSDNNDEIEANNLQTETKLPPPGVDVMAAGMFQCLVYSILNIFFSHPGNLSTTGCVVYCQGACSGHCCQKYYPYCDLTCGYCCCHW